MQCELCKKPIKKFTVTKDWKNRQYHKCCYKMMEKIIFYDNYMKL